MPDQVLRIPADLAEQAGARRNADNLYITERKRFTLFWPQTAQLERIQWASCQASFPQ